MNFKTLETETFLNLISQESLKQSIRNSAYSLRQLIEGYFRKYPDLKNIPEPVPQSIQPIQPIHVVSGGGGGGGLPVRNY